MKTRGLQQRSLAVALLLGVGFCVAEEPTLPNVEKDGRVDQAAALQLLIDQRYDELAAVLESYRQRAAQDVAAGEPALVTVYVTFEKADHKLLARIDEWIKARPDSAEAYLARAVCRNELGWDARGGKVVGKTSADQFTLMEHFHKDAKKDIAETLERDPDNPIPYRVLIRLARNEDHEVFQRIVDKGLEKFPLSFSLRWNALSGLQPRWGGSYEEIRSFTQAAQKYADKNPRLKILLGYEDFAKGRDAEADDQDELAYEYYTKAISYGEIDEYYVYRSYVAHRLKRYTDSIADSDRATALKPWDPEDPYSPIQRTQTQLLRDWGKLHEEKNFEGIAPICAALAARWPDNVKFIGCRADMLMQAKKLVEALEAYKRVLELDPSNERAYFQCAQVFHTLKRDDETLPYLDKWIGIAPQNPRPYALRAYVHGVMGSTELAKADLTKACELGDAQACTALERFKT